jgi:hypothetical protein
MEKIRIEKVLDPKHITGDKNGRHYDFWSYSITANNRIYGVKGYGAENLKEGMTVQGFISERPYTDKDGNQKTAYDFTMVSKTTADIYEEIDKLWTEIANINAKLVNPKQATLDKLDEAPPITEEPPYDEEPF